MADYIPRFKKKSSLASYRAELLAALGIPVALFLMISLVSFSAQDSSWFYMRSDMHQVTNKCGVVGAYLASLIMYYLAGASLLLPLFLLCCSAIVLFRIPLRNEWDRLMALFFLMPTVATLCSMHRMDVVKNIFPGGVVGFSSARFMHQMFDTAGSFLILYSLLVIWMILIFRISCIGVARRVVMYAQWMVDKEKVIKPIGAGLVGAWRKTSHLFVATTDWVMNIFKANEITNSKESIFEFDSGLPVDQAVKNIHEDLFWNEYQKKTGNSSGIEDMTMSGAQMSSALPEETSTKAVNEPEHEYRLPDLSLFEAKELKPEEKKITEELKLRARTLEEKLERFGVCGSVVAIKPGPVVTLFEYEPQIDTKISKIIALEDDLAMALQALGIRIIAPIPGKSVVGFEVANQNRKSVYLASIVQSKEFKQFNGKLPLILGQDTVGNTVVVDLVKMPHLLIAGSTGSGKSVALNAMLVSMLCSRTPDELKLILIDPKRLEFAPYADIAHLLFPIITDPRKAAPVLRWVVQTMEMRYEKMATMGVRSIVEYKKMVATDRLVDEMPYIVVVIDELADLMMTAGKDIEDLITRLSQMARAAGIHLMVATQRPSVDVITGLIKVNFPSRISFRVTSKVDSRTILDCGGADKLLGRGDMLFLDSSSAQLQRVHGAYVSDKEIVDLVSHIRSERSVSYLSIEQELASAEGAADIDDELYRDIVFYLNEVDEVSISMLQRRFRIGYNRSARIIDALEAQGKIMPADGARLRKVIR